MLDQYLLHREESGWKDCKMLLQAHKILSWRRVLIEG